MEQEFTGEFEMNLKERRSSILKKEKPKNTDENETDPPPRLSRRVSFASSNFIKPFASDPEDNTIWDSTYEEQINHTDSTKSASEKSQDTSPDIFNVSVWDNRNYLLVGPTDIMPDKENIPVRKPFAAITPEDFVVNKENIFFQQELISLKEKSVNITTNTSTFMDITGIQTEKKCIPPVKKKEIESIVNEGHTVPKTRYTNTAEGDVEMMMASPVQPHLTGILKKKTCNQSSCIESTQTSESTINQGNRRRFCEARDSMDFSAYVNRVLRRNGNELTENLSQYCFQRNDTIKSDQNTIMYGPFEGRMEITSGWSNETLVKGYEDMEITSMVPISEKVISENKTEPSSLFEWAKVYGQTEKCRKEEIAKSDYMEVNSVLIEEHGNNTKIFTHSVGDMELTKVLQTQDKLENEMVLPSQAEKYTFLKDKSLMEITYDLTSTQNKEENLGRDKGSTTLSFKEKSDNLTKEKSDISANVTLFKRHNKKEESMMELTSVLSSTEQLKNPNLLDKNISNDTNFRRKTQVLSPSEGHMELTSVLQSAEQLKNPSYADDTNSSRKTQVFLPSEGDMEFTSVLPSAEQLKNPSYLPDKNISNDTNSGRKTQIFQPSEGDMELTSDLPSAEQLNNPSYLRKSVSDDTNSSRKTQVFLPSEGDMEFTSVLPSAEQLTNASYLPDKNIANDTNFRRKTQIFQPPEGDMELTSVLPSAEQLENPSYLHKSLSGDTNSSRKTHVFLPSEGDMEFTSVLPSAEQLKNASYLPDKNIANDTNSRRKTQIFQPSEGDMELTSDLPSAEQLNNLSYLHNSVSDDTNSSRKTQVFLPSEGDMEFTSVLPSAEQLKNPSYLHKSLSDDTNSSRKTHVFLPSEGDMEFTSALPSGEQLKNPSYLPDKNIANDTNSRRKTHIFQPSEGDMDLTSVLPSSEQLTNPSYLPDKSISNYSNSLRKTQVFLPSERDVEFTSDLASAEQLKNPSYFDKNASNDTNSSRKTHIFLPSEGDMEFTAVVPSAEQLKNPSYLLDKNVSNDTNSSQKTHVFLPSEGDMEFTSVLLSAEQLKNLRYLSAKNVANDIHSSKNTQVFQSSEEDVKLSTVLRSAEELKRISCFPNKNISPAKILEIEEGSRLPSETTHIISHLTNSEEERKNTEATFTCFEEKVPIRIIQKEDTEFIPSDRKDITSELVAQKENAKPAVQRKISEPLEANMESDNVSQTVEINEVHKHSLRFNASSAETVNLNEGTRGTKNITKRPVKKNSEQFGTLNQFPADDNVDFQRNISSDNKQELDTVAETSQGNLQPYDLNKFLANTSEAQEEEKIVTNFITYRRSKHVPFLSCNESSVYLSQRLNVDKLDKCDTEPSKESSNLNILNVENVDEETVDEPKEKIVSCNNFQIGPNILFSAKIDSRISEADQISATPPSSFYRHYHNPNEDTQQLINATTSHPESFKLELSQRLNQVNEENYDDDSFVDRAYNLKDSSSANSNDFSKKVLSDKSIVDTTPIDFVDLSNPMELDESVENETKSEHNQTTHIVNRIRNSDYHNYTVRSNTLLQNIKEYLITPSEEEIAREKLQEERIKKLHQDVRGKWNKIKELLKNYRLPQVDLVLLEDKLQVESEDSRSSNSSSGNNLIMEQLTNRESVEILPTPKTVYERVYEAAERSKVSWELVKTENDYYYFYTLYGTVPFKVHTHPELGLVYSVETYYNMSDASKPLGFYLAEIIHQKLKKENLLASLGPKYDILTLLDYVSMNLHEIYDFEKEFSRLCTKHRNYQITMDKEFRLSFQFLNVKRMIWWNVSVTLSPNNIGCPVDISAVEKIGEKVNEDHIKNIAQNTPTGIHFLANFIKGIEEYAQRMGRKLHVK